MERIVLQLPGGAGAVPRFIALHRSPRLTARAKERALAAVARGEPPANPEDIRAWLYEAYKEGDADLRSAAHELLLEMGTNKAVPTPAATTGTDPGAPATTSAGRGGQSSLSTCHIAPHPRRWLGNAGARTQAKPP